MARVSSLGEVAAVRHVVVRFDAAGVPFGEPRLPDPMVVACEEATPPGSGRWLDARTWAQDFRRALPPGSRCSVRRRGDWQPSGGAMAALPLTGSALLKAGELQFAGYEVCSFVPPQAVETQPACRVPTCCSTRWCVDFRTFRAAPQPGPDKPIPRVPSPRGYEA